MDSYQNRALRVAIGLLLVAVLLPQQTFADRFIKYLNGRTITAIAYDSKRGLIWFGTGNTGLIKFDGSTFTQCNFLNSSLACEPISSLALDHNYNLWVGINSEGVGHFKVEENAWEVYNTKNGLTNNHVRSIAVDNNGHIWLGTDDGVGLFDGSNWYRYKTDRYERWNPTTMQWEVVDACKPNTKYLLDNGIYDVAVDSANKVWFGTERGISVRKNECEWATILVGQPVFSVLIDRRGYKWVGTLAGLYKLASDDATWEMTPSHFPLCVKGPIYTSIMDYEGNLWFGTDRGAPRFDPYGGMWQCSIGFPDLDENPVTSIAADEDGDLWFGSGLSPLGIDLKLARVIKYNANWRTFSTTNDDSLKELDSSSILSMVRDQLGRIWVGTAKGIARYDSSGWKIRSFNNQTPIFAIATGIAYDTTVWLGTYNGLGLGQVIRINPDFSIKETFLVGGSFVYSIALSKDRAWFGTNNGLYCLNLTNRNWQNFTKENSGLIDDGVYALAIDWRGFLWCGTHRGVNYYDGTIWESFTTAEGLLNNYINSISIDYTSRRVCFATLGGVAIVDTNFVWSDIIVDDGLISDIVNDVQISNDGREIWIATIEGISYRGANGKWTNYTSVDGLADDDVRAIRPGLTAREIWFGTSNGITRYRQAIKYPNTVILNPFNIITTPEVIFHYLGNDLNTPKGQLLYSYKLDGQRWSEFTFNTSALFTVTKNGLHTFYVKALDKDNHEDLTPATNSFYKLNPDEGSYTTFTDNSKIHGFDSVKIELYWPPYQLTDTVIINIEPIPNYTINSTEKRQRTVLLYDFKPYSIDIRKGGVILRFEFPQLIAASNQSLLIQRDLDAQGRPDSTILASAQKIEGGYRNITTVINQFGRYAVRTRDSSLSEQGPFAEARVTAQPRIFSPRGGGHGPQTSLSFKLDKSANVRVKVYDLAGGFVKMLFDSPMNAGINVVAWDGLDYNDQICPTGLYILIIESQGFRSPPKPVKVMVLNK